MNEEAKKRLSDQINKLEEITDNISGWVKAVPYLEKSKQELRWALNTLESAPDLSDYPDVGDPFIRQLIASGGTISHTLMVPSPPANVTNISGVVGTTSANMVIQWVDSLRGAAENEPEVSDWIEASSQEYEEITDRQTKSRLVNERLKQLSHNRKVDLVALHDKARAATMVAVANVGNSSDAATLMRDLLDDFKENVLSRCNASKNPPQIYYRIANNLAINAPVTDQTIRSGEIVHKNIHDELSQILKLKRVVPTSRLRELLHEVEDHIWVITEAIDPTKIKIQFVR